MVTEFTVARVCSPTLSSRLHFVSMRVCVRMCVCVSEPERRNNTHCTSGLFFLNKDRQQWTGEHESTLNNSHFYNVKRTSLFTLV